jgi:hypothetical protein
MRGIFKMKIPQYICTREIYPLIHKDHEGRAMPEALGLCSLVAADSHTPGAIEAVLIDKPAKKYLCARGSLRGIDQVYANGKIKNSGWTVSYADGGRTYLTFTNSQGAKRITFNCRGYMYAAWDSANGYVQNPAYVLLFYLAFFLGVAQDDLNIQSFIDMAAYFVDQGWDEAGKFIAQEQSESNSSLQELLVSFGLRYWNDTDGRIKVGRRDVSTYTSAEHIFCQLDVLDRPEKPMNWGEAINYLAYTWDNFPCSNVMIGSGITLNQDSIDFLGEKRSELGFPWTTDENMALALAEEELFRMAYGNPKFNAKIPFFWLNHVDIGDVVAIQDLFGINVLGLGEATHYYLINSISPDFKGYNIALDLEDTTYLLGIYDDESQPLLDDDGSILIGE